MVRSALYILIIFITLFILNSLIPNEVYAQTACKSISNCNLSGKLDKIKEYDLDSDDNPECVDFRQFYFCNETRCYQDSTTCTEQQGICNNDSNNTPNDGYTCFTYCNALATPDNCGNYPETDLRPTCSTYISTCLTRYCIAVGGGVNYTCPNGQQCVSPPDSKAHQCVTPVAVPVPAPLAPPPASCSCTPENDVTCNQTVSSYSNCPTCPGTGTKCVPPTNECTIDGCKPPNPESLCPAGEVLNDKFLYSCVPGNSGNSCPAGSQSSVRTCPAGKTCCYSLLVGPPKEKSPEGWCSVSSAVSTGTNSATAEGDRYGFNRIDCDNI